MRTVRRGLFRACLLLALWQLGVLASSPVIISCHGEPAEAKAPCCNGEHEGAVCPMHKRQPAPDATWRAGCHGADLLASLFGVCGVLPPAPVFGPLFTAFDGAPDLPPAETSFEPLPTAPPPRA